MDYPFEAWEKKPAKAGFFISGSNFLRTRVYIDGYNLYYGCLKGTALKWLDVCSLFSKQILPTSCPSSFVPDELFIKFFTAPILIQAARAEDSLMCQEQYHSALRKHTPDSIEIIKGYYDLKAVRARQIDPTDPKKWPRHCSDIEVWKLEEKQSDVNLAIHLLKDALHEGIEQLIVATNDTDLAPALAMVRELTQAKIGLVIPTTNRHRRPNEHLAKYAHWVREHITLDELKASQLPRVVKLDKKSATKPTSWFQNSEILEQVLTLGVTVRGSKAEVYKWLDRPNPHFDNRTGLDLIESGDGARLLDFMKQWPQQNGQVINKDKA